MKGFADRSVSDIGRRSNNKGRVDELPERYSPAFIFRARHDFLPGGARIRNLRRQ